MAEPYTNLWRIWRRSREHEYATDTQGYYIVDNSSQSHFNQFDFNEFVDIRTKEAALRVSPSLVSLISYSALGRYHSEQYDLMTAPGKFSIDRCDALFCSIDRCGLDCKELLRVNCKITKDFTPFLPMNVVCKWWEHVKGSRIWHWIYDRPWLGMQVIHLFATEVDELEKIVLKFPNISEGVIVEEVTQESPAAFAGICPNDVIVQFGGKDVQSCLELFEITWDKVGKRVDLVVLRASSGVRLDLSMVVGGVNTGQLNRWP